MSARENTVTTIDSPNMTSEISAKEMFEYSRASGCPLSEARRVLEAMAPALRDRALTAARAPQKRNNKRFHDPLEDDPALGPVIQQAAGEARASVLSGASMRRGACYAIWREQARILLERHQVVWFSPAQMNPLARFD